MSFKTRKILYLNPEKVRALYGQMFGYLPTISITHENLGGRATITATLGAEAAAAVGMSRETHKSIPAEALTMQILGRLQRQGDYVADANKRRFSSRISRKGPSFIATIDGTFHVEPTTTIEAWLSTLRDPGHVTLFLDEMDRRAKDFRRSNPAAHGIWFSMNTDYLTESRHPSAHIGQRIRVGNSLQLSVTGWIESSGYLNPLCVFW